MKFLKILIAFCVLLILTAPPLLAQPSRTNKTLPALPAKFKARDYPGDKGKKIQITWEKSKDEKNIKLYYILRARHQNGPYKVIAKYPPRIAEDKDKKDEGYDHFDKEVENGVPYFYKIKVLDKDGNINSSVPTKGIIPNPQIFNTNQISVFSGVYIYIGIILMYLSLAKRKKDMFIRKIAGLDAVDEAIGRATEMGKPILYISGLHGIADISTLASITILGQVAKKVAEYESPLIVPCCDVIVMAVEREVVKEAYMAAGKPDAYKDDSVFFLSDSQFAYAAGVDGIMVREKPAANFYMGYFYAESLILAETGAATGAIQIAGTDALAQIPFFITSCDYTLIGEELYAASAYLSREPLLLGALKAQDMGKLIIMILLVIGIILETTGLYHLADVFKIID